MNKWLKNDHGAVALITTIIISLLLGIIVTNLIGLMTTELQQQDDSEQATLAYFAAESGVEDAVGKILQGHLTTNQTTCNPVAVGTSTTEFITCELITLSGNPTGTLSAPDQAVQIDTDGSKPFNKVVFEWDQAQTKFTCTTLTPAASWIAGTPCAPPLEVATVQYPRGTFAANTTSAITKNALFMPGTGSGQANYVNLSGHNPIQGHCTAGGPGYHCTATLIGLSVNSSYILRLRTRYLGTSYRVTAYNGNTPVDILDGSASIDVTARSGSAYRRVLYKVPYEKGVASGLDYVLYSDSQVCKNFYLLNGNVNPNPSACP